MSVRPLLILCILGIVLSVVVASLAARDLMNLPSVDAFPDVRSPDLTKLSGNNTRFTQLALQWSGEVTASLKSFRSASASALALARSGAQERVILGLGFGVIFLLLSLQIMRLARKT